MKKFISFASLGLLIVFCAMFFVGCFGTPNVAGKSYAYDSFSIKWLSDDGKNMILTNRTEEEFLSTMRETITSMYGNLLITFNEDLTVTATNSSTQETMQTLTYVQENNKINTYQDDEFVTTYHIKNNKFYYETERDIDQNGEPELLLTIYFKMV